MSYWTAIRWGLFLAAIMPRCVLAAENAARSVTHWIDRADADLARAALDDPKDRAVVSKLDVAVRLYELEPAPLRLERVRAVADEFETFIKESKDPARQIGGRQALIPVYARILKDPARCAEHLRLARKLVEGGELEIKGPLGIRKNFFAETLVAAIADSGDLKSARIETERLPGGGGRVESLCFVARLINYNGLAPTALTVLTWATAEVDSVTDESERDEVSRSLARDLALGGDFETAMRVAAGIKDTHKSFDAHRAIIEAARTARQDEKYIAAYDSAKMLWHFSEADSLVSLAERLAELGDRARAQETLSAALEKNGNWPAWFLTRAARVHARLNDRGQFEKLAERVDRMLSRDGDNKDRARAQLVMARSFAILGDFDAMNRRIAQVAQYKDVDRGDLVEEQVDLLHTLLALRRWADAQQQIDLLPHPEFKEMAVKYTVRAQVRAGEMELAARTVESAKGWFDRLVAWRLIAVERARRGHLDELEQWIDQLEGPLCRAVVKMSVAEALAGKPAKWGRMFFEE